MEDICYDQLMAVNRKGRAVLVRILLILGAALLVLASFIFPIRIGEMIIAWYVIAAAIDFVVIKLLWNRVATEYEYCFTDGQVDIDAIYSQKTRKRQISFDCKDIAMMAPKEEVKYQTIFQREYDAVYDFTDRRYNDNASSGGTWHPCKKNNRPLCYLSARRTLHYQGN